jgi:hypothetical protein
MRPVLCVVVTVISFLPAAGIAAISISSVDYNQYADAGGSGQIDGILHSGWVTDSANFSSAPGFFANWVSAYYTVPGTYFATPPGLVRSNSILWSNESSTRIELGGSVGGYGPFEPGNSGGWGVSSSQEVVFTVDASGSYVLKGQNWNAHVYLQDLGTSNYLFDESYPHPGPFSANVSLVAGVQYKLRGSAAEFGSGLGFGPNYQVTLVVPEVGSSLLIGLVAPSCVLALRVRRRLRAAEMR